jgi:S-DNA-T family DNA segregation ATPase FtsK/SpoIIIE
VTAPETGARTGQDEPRTAVPTVPADPYPEVPPPPWATALADLASRIRWRARPKMWWVVLGWRLAVLAVRGSRRGIRAWWRWVTVADLTKALTEPSSDTLAVFVTRGRVRWFRLGLTAGAAVLAVLAVLLAVLTLAIWVAAPALAAPVVTGAVVGGRRDGEKILTRPRGTVAITGNAIIDAHRNAGIIKADANLTFVVPPTREGEGLASAMRMLYDLPPGRTSDEVVKKLRPLASALRRPVEALDVHEGEHAGQVDLRVAEKSPYKIPVPPWPWLDRDQVDLFTEPIPQGIDLRGQPVTLPLLWTAALISARPRRGKSYELRKLLLAAALDPHTRIVIVNPKLSGDFKPLIPVCYRYIEHDPARTLDVLRELEAQMWRANAAIGGLPVDLAPESKITRAIHRDPNIDARLTVVAIDEIRIPFADADHGEPIKEVLTTLAQVGPAAGYIVLAATQRPDGTVVPVGWRSVMGTRIALQVMTEGDSKIGLGAHHSDLHDASRLPATPGVAIVAGDVEAHVSAPDGPRITRLHEVSTLGAMAVAEWARARRVELGLLEGDAAGDTAIGAPAPAAEMELVDIRGQVAAVIRAGGADRLGTRTILVGLGRLAHDATEGDARAAGKLLAEELRPYGVGPTDIRIDGRTVSGYRLDDLVDTR